MTKYEVDVKIEVDTAVDPTTSLASSMAVYAFVDAALQQAHDDAARRQGGFPGWHFEMTEGCVSSEDDAHDITIRPTDFCDCGYPVVWVEGRWEHDAAPYLWGDDHDADAPEPTGGAREYWDIGDGITRYTIKKDELHQFWGIWDTEADTWHEGTYDDVVYAAGVPMWRSPRNAQTVVEALHKEV